MVSVTGPLMMYWCQRLLVARLLTLLESLVPALLMADNTIILASSRARL